MRPRPRPQPASNATCRSPISTAPAIADAGTDVAVSVRVTNLGGHKFPTGYPEGRRAWIYLAGGEDLDSSGTLSAGEITWESCAYDQGTGALTEDPQAKIYEAKLGIFNHLGTRNCDVLDAGGEPMCHGLRNAGCNPTVADGRSNRGERMRALWEAYGRSAPVDLSISRAIIAVTPAPPVACCFPAGCVDMLPGQCDLNEGTSLGAATSCGVDACPVLPSPPGEASDVVGGDSPLLVSRDRVTGELTLTYAPACDA